MTIREIYNASHPEDYRMNLYDLFIQAKRAEFVLWVTHDSTVYEDRSTFNQGSGYFKDGSSYGDTSIECWSRTPTATLHELDVQLDPFAVTPNTTLPWFNNESLYVTWTYHTDWGQSSDPYSNTLFDIEVMNQSAGSFILTNGGESKYYQFQETGPVIFGESTTKTRWSGGTQKSKFRLYRPRPTKEPVDLNFLKVTTEYPLVMMGNDPENVGWAAAPPTTSVEVVNATIPAFGHTSPWIETTPAVAAAKDRSVILVPAWFHTYPDSEAGPDKAHRRNLTTKQNETAKYGAGWDKVVSKLWSSQGTINLIDYLEGGWGNHAKFENLVKWKVNGVVQTSHEIGFGNKPNKDLHTKVLVEVLPKNGGPTLDRLIITIIPAETKTKFDNWYAAESTAAGKAWFAECPRMPTSLEIAPLLPPDRLFSPRIWRDPSTLETEIHPDAYFEMRAKITPGGHGHQVNFTDKGTLILKGVSAGSADKYAPIPEGWQNPLGHLDNDVIPYVWALQLDGNPCNQTADLTHLTLPMLHEGAFITKYLICRPPEPNAKPSFTPEGTP